MTKYQSRFKTKQKLTPIAAIRLLDASLYEAVKNEVPHDQEALATIIGHRWPWLRPVLDLVHPHTGKKIEY